MSICPPVADTLVGSKGNDRLDGGAGIDTADYSLMTMAMAGGVDADLGKGIAYKIFAGTNVSMGGMMGKYIRIYHYDSIVGLGLTGMKVYDASGRDVAAGRRSAIGINSYESVNSLSSVADNSNVALTDEAVGGGWNGLQGDAGNVAYVKTTTLNYTGDVYIELVLDSAYAIDSISLWGDANNPVSSQCLRVFVSNVPFSAWMTSASEAENVAHFDLARVETNTTSAWIDTLISIENLIGTAMNDRLTGDANANVLSGSGGNDRLDGAAGNDTASFALLSCSVDADLGRGTAIKGLAGANGAGTDTLISIENLVGTAMNDRLTGDANANLLDGGAGNDVLSGSAGNDTLNGGAGIDTAQYSSALFAYGIDADLARGTAIKGLAGTKVSTAGTTGRYIRIYHNDNYVQGSQGHELGLTGMKVYDASGRDAASGLRSSIGTDGDANSLLNSWNVNTSGVALTDAIVGGGWNGQAGDAGTVAYVNTSYGGAKGYIQLDLGSAQALDSISLWGDANYARDSKNLRIYVSNTAFNASTNYTSLAADQNVNRFDLAEVETRADIDTLAGIENLIGTAMNDALRGDANANVLDGGAGNDVLSGSAGNDTLVGGVGSDTLDGGAGIDTADYSLSSKAMAGGINASLATGKVEKVMAGTSVGIGSNGRYIRIYHNDNYVQGSQGHELGLTGMKVYDTSGRDVASGLRSSIGTDGDAYSLLNGYNQNTSTVALTDALVGGGWNGLAGDAGTVAYVNTGYGGAKGYIQLDLGSAQALDSISLWGDQGWEKDSKNLRVYVSNTAFNTSTNYTNLAADQNVVRFDLAGVETRATAYTDTLVGIENLTGTAMNDTLTGDVNANVLVGGAGNDMLAGGLGSDTYKFQRGDGMDTIVDMDYMAGYSPDLLQFQGDISSGQLWFRHAGNDLEASIIGTADKAVVQNWYSGSAYHVEQIKAGDGKLLLDTQVENLVQAMASFAPPAMGQTTLTSAQQTALAPALAASWH